MYTALNKRIMRRVWCIHVVRRMLHPSVVKVYILAAFAWHSLSYVSVGNVFANASEASIASLYTFTLSAVSNTEGFVQVALVVGALLLTWLVADIVRKRFSTDTPLHRVARIT